MTNEQSATLLRLNKQAQVAALNAVGFSDITENSRASEFGQRIKWAAGLFIKRGLRIRAHGHSFVISAQECYNADMTTTFYWGGQGKAIDGLNQKGLGAMYGCFTGEEDTDLIIATLKDQNNSGVIGAPAAEAARASNWFLPSSGQMLLMYRYRDKINEMMRTFWSSDSMLMTDKYYWSSTIWDTNSAWAFELNTGRITNQNKNSALLHVRAVASE